MSLNLEIEGQSKPIETFALPEMSLSSARSKMVPWKFSIRVKETDLISLLSEDYQRVMSDLKEDDMQVGSPQSALGEAGYPELIEILKKRELLELAVAYFLFETLISKYSLASSKTEYWHDEIYSCKYESGVVEIYGICYSKKRI